MVIKHNRGATGNNIGGQERIKNIKIQTDKIYVDTFGLVNFKTRIAKTSEGIVDVDVKCNGIIPNEDSRPPPQITKGSKS